ncbi:RDD family protein [Halobacillus sp. Nhm2S1]|uniref:RDD family protein n=1 Tax=Halobacillus sp. Nhm2S1 TaxID=2866716 RepID=UPI001C73378F|nr:RDD family protein [Halobacillus sp. Nhm2S1]MBX0357745.1 RDD family protein [Halobacillus sp. Nhm2S1]
MDIKQPAGFWARFAARVLDGIILGVIFTLLTYLIYGEFFRDYSPLDSLNVVYFVVLPIVWSGYTIGKKAAGIRILQKDGTEVGIGRMLLREVVGFLVYALTLGIGLIVSAFMVGIREDKRAIHDFIAGTYVTHQAPDTTSKQVMEGNHA